MVHWILVFLATPARTTNKTSYNIWLLETLFVLSILNIRGYVSISYMKVVS